MDIVSLVKVIDVEHMLCMNVISLCARFEGNDRYLESFGRTNCH